MKSFNIVRSLKDKKYRNGLSENQLAQVGQNPAGLAELDESVLDMVAGGPQSNNGCGSRGAGTTFCYICQQ